MSQLTYVYCTTNYQGNFIKQVSKASPSLLVLIDGPEPSAQLAGGGEGDRYTTP